MKRILSAFAVLATLAFGLTAQVGTASAAGAAGVRAPAPVEQSANPLVEKVDHHWRRDHRWRGRDRGWDRDRDRRYRHYAPRSGFYLEFGTPRRYVAPPPRRAYGVSRAHVNWCANRYRSYDARSDSFQPYSGPRRRCVSPYS